MSTVGSRRYLTGDDLISLRSKIGWSQQAVAAYLGLRHEAQLDQIESGRRWISYAEEVLLRELEAAYERGELQGAGQRPLASGPRPLPAEAALPKEVREHPAQSIYESRISSYPKS